jgi:anthranilate synthase component 1/para-aminobenzoate synthetase
MGSEIRPRPVLLAIDGRSGSGKTSLAHALTHTLRTQHGLDVGLFHVEHVYRGWSGLEEGLEHYVAQVLVPLRRGERARWFPWDWKAHTVATAPRFTRPAGVVLCEGVGSASPAAHPLLDAALRLRAPASLRKERALARDGETYRPFWDMWAAQEERLGSPAPGRHDTEIDLEVTPDPHERLDLATAWALEAIGAGLTAARS